MLGIGVLLTVGTGVFVGSEFALVNLDRNDLEKRRERGEKRLTPTINALKHTSTHLSSAQLGITLTTLLTGYTMEPAISSLLSSPLGAVGLPEDAVRPVGAVLAIVIATGLSMVMGELIPKNFALAVPRATAKFLIPLQVAFTTVFRPAVAVLNGSANGLIRALGIEPKEELSGARTAEELSSLVRRSALVGLLEGERAVLLSRTLRFSDHIAADVMTPRPRVQSIAVDAPVQDLIDLAKSTGHSRFPVTGEDIDEIVGVAHLKNAVSLPLDRRRSVPVGAIKTDALLVPETLGLDALLAELRSGGFQLAVVLDEYGGTNGVVTLEDLVEEIVGELVDEHDRAHLDVVRAKGRTTFDGMLRPDEVRDRLNIELDDDGPFETVAGFMMNALERIPAVGDEVQVPVGTFRVERMEGRRVDRVAFTPNESYESREALMQRLADKHAEKENRG
ncbi:hypothetical protein C5E10_05510 [Pseudoclavibacter sp. RFBG4]|uniref:hemolysin family protein n=1 Tax=unclassified Pseudoclavibacter TaxID=2615177 RepID=UPI000CE80D28|nr:MULTISPECIES: hemolysin family protein [unclassified Pseudoclavibacter]MBF4457983.1 HlyC/CorC family transporter [Pseudoclavibacter sp. VKM Ac-2867]MBF4549632.1 HlyC/CorC family transporter [Pseudoclavibacter sp. VKM Ac-2888]PPF76489.1 hypothetical protein C5B99_09695 [Pseudoclavibacter sp. Z016]PPG35203.1 hypothetical protein C5E10_05510 [Pseudoclavibacter sp. RFBG4]